MINIPIRDDDGLRWRLRLRGAVGDHAHDRHVEIERDQRIAQVNQTAGSLSVALGDGVEIDEPVAFARFDKGRTASIALAMSPNAI